MQSAVVPVHARQDIGDLVAAGPIRRAGAGERVRDAVEGDRHRVADAIAALRVHQFEPEREAVGVLVEALGDEVVHVAANVGAVPETAVSTGGDGVAAFPSMRAIRAMYGRESL